MDRTAALGSEDEHSDDDHFVDTTRTRQNYDFDLGQHLLGFLELYGCTFDYRQLGISIVNEGGYFPKVSLYYFILFFFFAKLLWFVCRNLVVGYTSITRTCSVLNTRKTGTMILASKSITSR